MENDADETPAPENDPELRRRFTPAAEVHRDDYDRNPRLNWSRLRLLERSPAHYKAGYGDESDSLRLGTAVHMAVLEPARYAKEYVVYPGKTRRGKEWEAFETDAVRRGLTVVSRSEQAKTLAVRDAVHGNRRAMEYLSGGKPEVTYEWTIGADDVRFECKGRADYVGPLGIVDLKSTQCAAPKAFAHSVLKYGYDGQAAWYRDGYQRSHGARVPFTIIAVESAPPHLVTVFRMPDAVMQRGQERYETLLAKLHDCQTRNYWGGYVEADEVDLELPPVGGWMEE